MVAPDPPPPGLTFRVYLAFDVLPPGPCFSISISMPSVLNIESRFLPSVSIASSWIASTASLPSAFFSAWYAVIRS